MYLQCKYIYITLLVLILETYSLGENLTASVASWECTIFSLESRRRIKQIKKIRKNNPVIGYSFCGVVSISSKYCYEIILRRDRA